MKARLNDVEIAYELHGSGVPLLMIQGLGLGRWAWFKQVPYLEKHFQVITFDNRGAGESSKPRKPYSIEIMAKDAIALLDYLGVGQAHMIGASLGGMIAQHIAAQDGMRVKKLVLACSSPGYSLGVPLFDGMNQVISLPGGKNAADMLRNILAPPFANGLMEAYPEFIERMIQLRLEHHTPFYAWKAQVNAALQFDMAPHLQDIRCPTLIMTGDKDAVVPCENSYILHQHIPRSELFVIPGAGHLFFIEQAHAFNQQARQFLSK